MDRKHRIIFYFLLSLAKPILACWVCLWCRLPCLRTWTGTTAFWNKLSSVRVGGSKRQMESTCLPALLQTAIYTVSEREDSSESGKTDQVGSPFWCEQPWKLDSRSLSSKEWAPGAEETKREARGWFASVKSRQRRNTEAHQKAEQREGRKE